MNQAVKKCLVTEDGKGSFIYLPKIHYNGRGVKWLPDVLKQPKYEETEGNAMTKEQREAEAEANKQKAIKELGVGSEEFLEKHKVFMTYCDRVRRMHKADLENKQLICDRLTRALQTTRGAHDLITLDYDEASGIVTATFASGGTRTINVEGDSGIAMIRDIMRGLGV